MKKYRRWIGLLLISCGLQACHEEESMMNGNVQFALRASAFGNSGGRALGGMAEGSVLFISVSRSNGDPVHVLKELTLVKFGDTFISDPLPLSPGNYTIIDFLVSDRDHNVLYAVPKEDSPLASWVEDSLPMLFTVDANEVTNLSVQVVSVDAHQPEEFGYVSFTVDVVPDEVFKLSVFVPEENGTFEFTRAWSYILHDGDTVYSKYILPSMNTLAFDCDPAGVYTLVLIKESFMKYSRTFSLQELTEELNGYPLSVTLVPAFTMVADPYFGANGYEAYLEMWTLNPALTGKLTVDWGDGTIEEVDVPHSQQAMNHFYPTSGKWFISISGDLTMIEYLAIFYFTPLDAISLRYLTELKSAGIAAIPTPPTIDISYNTKLESVSFGMTYVTSLDITNNHRLKSVNLLFNVNFSVPSLDTLIHNLLRNARDYHITEGDLTIVANGAGSGTIMGPPSASALEELRILRDNYGWTIEPASAL